MRVASWHDLGGIHALSLVVSRFWIDGGSMFGQVPKTLWSRYAKADRQNRIPMVVRALLLRTREALVLVEPGMGGDYADTEVAQMKIDLRLGDLPAVLRTAGVAAEEVTHAIVTHLHFDHVGGLGRRDATGGIAASLPRARVFVQRAQWERAQDPGPKERRSFRAQDLALLRASDLALLDGAAEILPGIDVRTSEGHTRAQQLVHVRGANEQLFYPADLIPMLAHIRAAYTLGFDLRPETVIEEKAALLAQAAAANAILVFPHDPRTAACRVAAGTEGFVVREKVAGWA